MREIIKRGETVDKVIESFKKEFHISEKEIQYTVEQKNSKGILSLFGKKDAIVKFVIPEVDDIIKKYLQELLRYLSVDYRDIEVKLENNTYHTHIKGVKEPGFLIGKEGKMLSSIQLLLNKIVDDEERKRDNVVLDIDNYRGRYNSRPNEARSAAVRPTDNRTKEKPKQKPGSTKKQFRKPRKPQARQESSN